MRTLAIASIASATAAAVTSQLWIAGTWVAAAVTPVLVTLLSEALGRPTEKIARAWTSDRPAVRETARDPVRVPDTEPSPRWPGLNGPPDDAAPPPRPGEPGPVRVYRGAGRRPPRRKIAFGAVAATAALAFVIGIVLLTGTELIAGESIGKGGGRTSIGIGSSSSDKKKDSGDDSEAKEQDKRSPADVGERPEGQQQQQPSTQPEEESPPTTSTTPTPTTPEQTTPRPTPAPQQAPAPPPSETAPAP